MKRNIVEFLPLFVLVFIISIEPVRGRIILTDDSIVVEGNLYHFNMVLYTFVFMKFWF